VDRRVDREVDGFDKPPILSMGESGTDVAVPRILELLDQYIFRLASLSPAKSRRRIQIWSTKSTDRGHEIGHHSYSHRNPTTMSDEEEKEDFERANKVFRDLLGETSVGYRTPVGDLPDRTLNRLVGMGFSTRARCWIAKAMETPGSRFLAMEINYQ